MSQCLETAHKAGMTSLSLPAMGTGGLGYPRDKTAAAMFVEVKKFSQNNPRTSLRDIRFSVFDQPTVQVRSCVLCVYVYMYMLFVQACMWLKSIFFSVTKLSWTTS